MTVGDVLVVDDNELTRVTLTQLLKEEGFTVDSCASGRSALDLTIRKPFQIFVIDYSMPEMKGDAVTAEVRKLHPSSFIIGFSFEPKESAFLEAGADKFLLKEYLLNDLVGLIKERRVSSSDQ